MSSTDNDLHFFAMEIGPIYLLGTAVFGITWGIIAGLLVRSVDMSDKNLIDGITACQKKYLQDETHKEYQAPETIKNNLNKCEELITEGAKAFLMKEYIFLTVWSSLFAIVLGSTVDYLEMRDAAAPTDFPYTATSYLLGSATSIAAGYIGMRIAVYTNVRVTFKCCDSVHKGFVVAFRGGQVLGFVLVGLGLLILTLILLTFRGCWYEPELAKILALHPTGAAWNDGEKFAIKTLTRRMMELIAGYGLGGSSVALFGRVGGGIYTKAADVGADLVGKTLMDLKEDDINNPGTIADNVGDNVGDIAGMGSDLFGSLAESTCAALVVSATSWELICHKDALFFPLCITASGVLASWVSVLFIHARTATIENVQSCLKTQIGLSTIFMTGAVIPSLFLLPDGGFTFSGGAEKAPLTVTKWISFGCVLFGLWSGMIIGFITEYYTNNAYAPTLHLADACDKGPAPNIILGLALGYHSVIVPIVCLTCTIGFAFAKAGMYGIALSALGMLGSLPVALSVDGYGPISDNAGGIAEMSGLPRQIRDQTDSLDAAGNTTAAVGKGFAIGSACLVGLALFGAFITRIGDRSVDILMPTQFAGLLIGAMLPYAFSALTIRAVGDAAYKMMNFIIDDYKTGMRNEKMGKGPYKPDYESCIKISTEASLIKMIAPGSLVIGTPMVAGFVFGPDAVAGVLAGNIVSGVQVAFSSSNAGGAWDNAKKEVEKVRAVFRLAAEAENIDLKDMKKQWEQMEENGVDPDSEEYKKVAKWAVEDARLRDQHVASVVGDTVGDPLKDTSGPAINILVKLSAITSLVFGTYIKNYHIFEPK